MAIVRIIDPEGKARATLVVEVAATDAALAQGLGGRPQVRPGTGMLFLFKGGSRVAFTVAPMHVPIDLLWLDRTGRVIGMAPDLVPGAAKPVVAPGPFWSVLETADGTIRALDILPGWRVV